MEKTRVKQRPRCVVNRDHSLAAEWLHSSSLASARPADAVGLPALILPWCCCRFKTCFSYNKPFFAEGFALSGSLRMAQKFGDAYSRAPPLPLPPSLPPCLPAAPPPRVPPHKHTAAFPFHPPQHATAHTHHRAHAVPLREMGAMHLGAHAAPAATPART